MNLPWRNGLTWLYGVRAKSCSEEELEDFDAWLEDPRAELPSNRRAKDEVMNLFGPGGVL